MEVELKSSNTAQFRRTTEFESFSVKYIKDRFTTCSLFSYSRRCKVYFSALSDTKFIFFDYTYFGGLTFRSATLEGRDCVLFVDEPFRSFSISTIVNVLDSLKFVYLVDTVGIFIEVK